MAGIGEQGQPGDERGYGAKRPYPDTALPQPVRQKNGERGGEPAGEVVQGHTEIWPAVLPNPEPAPGKDGVYRQVPGGHHHCSQEGEPRHPAQAALAAGNSPVADEVGDEVAGIHHHEPTDGDGDGNVAQPGPQQVGVMVTAVDEAGGHPNLLEEPGDNGAQGEKQQRPPPAQQITSMAQAEQHHGRGLQTADQRRGRRLEQDPYGQGQVKRDQGRRQAYQGSS